MPASLAMLIYSHTEVQINVRGRKFILASSSMLYL